MSEFGDIECIPAAAEQQARRASEIGSGWYQKGVEHMQGVDAERMLKEAPWIDAFALHLGALDLRADPEGVTDLARELYPTMGHIDPRVAAEAEYAESPPRDG